jgi:exonuclease VII small subunit
MKNTTQQILDLIEAENFSELFKLKESVNSYGWGEQETQEMNFEEALVELESIVNVLLSSIKDKNNLFENFFIFQERNHFLSQLQNLNSYITNIKNGTNQVPNFIQFVQQIKQIIRNLEKEIKGYPNYQEKLKNLNYLKHRYEELIQELKEAEELKKEAEEFLNSISEKDTKVGEYLSSVEESDTQISSIEKDIEERYSDIKTRDSNITDYKAEAEQNKDSILKFFEKIDEYTKNMKTELNSVTESLEKGEEKLTKIITDNTIKTDKIVSENTKLQTKIVDILGKSIGTNLYKSFNSKANWLFGQSIFWLIILGFSIWFLTDSGRYVFEQLSPLFENGKLEDIKLTFYLRLTLIFPAIYAVYFSASEFKNTSKLKEEYDFKSSVAVALHHFKELVENGKNEEATKFLIESTKNIFESPTEKVFGKKLNEKDLNAKAKSIVSDVADITGDIARKILPKDK